MLKLFKKNAPQVTDTDRAEVKYRVGDMFIRTATYPHGVARLARIFKDDTNDLYFEMGGYGVFPEKSFRSAWRPVERIA